MMFEAALISIGVGGAVLLAFALWVTVTSQRLRREAQSSLEELLLGERTSLGERHQVARR